jgi:hypothetical protein
MNGEGFKEFCEYLQANLSARSLSLWFALISALILALCILFGMTSLMTPMALVCAGGLIGFSIADLGSKG